MNSRSAVMLCMLALAPTAFPNSSRDGSWYAHQLRAEEEKYRKEDKSPLHNFLGVEFGCHQIPGEHWVHLKERFGPFGWIRITLNGASKRYKADAELTYHLTGGPSNLVRTAQGVAELFRNRFCVDLHEQPPSGTNCVWIAEGKSPPYDVIVKVCGPLEANRSNRQWNAYSLCFEVANRWLGENPKSQQSGWFGKIATWSEVFAPIRIEKDREHDPEAWLYSPPDEPTAEEQIARAIAERNPSLVPRYAGCPGTFHKDGMDVKYTGCTEREADFFDPCVSMFFRYCSAEEQSRMKDLAATPHRMRPRASGEKRCHSVGNIDGSVLPGDMVRWNSANGDWLTGVAVSQEEEGEYADAFKCKVRMTERILRAQEEDWLPSPASSNYQARVAELNERVKRWREEDNMLWRKTGRQDEKKISAAHKESFRRASRRLAELHKDYMPGMFIPMLFNCISLPTKEHAALTVKRREYQDLVRWQNGVHRAIRDILERLGRLCRDGRIGIDGVLSEAESRELDLSGYERNMVENGREWSQFGMGDAGIGIHGVRPPHVPLYPHDGVWSEWNPDAYVKHMSRYIDSESTAVTADYVGAFTAYVEFATNVDAFVDAKVAASFSRKIAAELKPQQRVWLVRELCLGYGVRSLAPWRVFAETGAFIAKGEGKDSSAELAWFRSVAGAQYFKGQMNRLADDAFRNWIRSKLEKFMERQMTDSDFEYVCTDEVLKCREERKKCAHDEEVRRPHDGGDVLPHPFTFLGCTFGKFYDLSNFGGRYTSGDEILHWLKNFRIDPYFGKVWMMVSLAPRSKIAFSASLNWSGQDTREELFALAKEIKADIERRHGITLGDFFFESGRHVCDEATWWKADGVMARSRSVFGPIRIELEATDNPRTGSPGRRLNLTVTDTATEALVEKERKENPLKYDREAERRRHERLMERARRKKREQKQNQDASSRGQPTAISP